MPPLSHQLQHESVANVHGVIEDNLINHFFINDLPLNSLWALKYLFDDCCIARIGKARQSSGDVEIVKRCEN